MLLGISIIFSALSLFLVIYVLMSPALTENAEQPSDHFNRFRYLWPWVSVLSGLIMPFLSWVYQKKVEKLIESAGYKERIFLREIVGLQGLSAMVTLVAVGLLIFNLALPWLLFLFILCLALWIGSYLPLLWLRKKMQERKIVIQKAFPFFLDMVTLCVEAGSNLQTALITAVNSMNEGALRDELQHALSDMRTGINRIEALKEMSNRCDLIELKQWVSSLAQAEFLGSSLGGVLRVQSDQFRQERFLKAEKQAAKTPVKLLFPLICFIFPCTFIVIAFPIAMKMYSMGIF